MRSSIWHSVNRCEWLGEGLLANHDVPLIPWQPHHVGRYEFLPVGCALWYRWEGYTTPGGTWTVDVFRCFTSCERQVILKYPCSKMTQEASLCGVLHWAKLSFLNERRHQLCTSSSIALVNRFCRLRTWCRSSPFLRMGCACMRGEISQLRLGFFLIEIVTSFRPLNGPHTEMRTHWVG